MISTIWLERVFGFEGGYSNDPKDPGGETKYGISKRAYPKVDIAALTRERAAEIYAKDYAKPFLRLHPALGYQMFDFSINVGVNKATKILQLILDVTVDGKLGPKTLAAIVDARLVAERLLAERLEYYTGLRGWERYGKGWARRVAENLSYLSVDFSSI